MDTTGITTTATENKLHFLDYWRVIRIRKAVIITVFLLVVLTTTFITYFLPKTYSSTVRIKVEKDKSDISGLFDRQNQTTYDPFFIQDQFEVIQSKVVLYNVISNLNLNVKWAKKYKMDTPLTTQRTFKILQKLIDVRQFRNTSIIEIKAFSDEPEEAAQIANEIANVYKKVRLDLQNEAFTKGLQKYQEKLDEQNRVVQKLQAEVDKLRNELDISDFYTDGNVPAQTLEPETTRKINLERINAITTYSQFKTMLDQFLAITNRMELARAISAAFSTDQELTELVMKADAGEQELVRLLHSKTEEHPDVQRAKSTLQKVNQQIEEKVRGIISGLQIRVNSCKAQVDKLTAELEEAKRLDNEKKEKARPYFEKKRELENQMRIRDAIQLKIVTEDIEKELPKTTIVQVISQAEPELKAVRPNFKVNIALGVFVGLMVGIMLAFFIEYLDTSVKTIDDVERALQAPVLGVIPTNVGLMLEEGPDSPHAEAYRVLRTNLLFSRKNPDLNTLTVVSGGAAEGKSTTVFNLAVIFAQNGQRVLLVDSDLRRPSLHKFLKVSNSIGLTNYLLRQNTLEEVIQTTPVPTLDFLPSGKLPSSSMGILNSPRMREFIKEVAQRYDFVFFDSPPIMGVSDASVLASIVDMVVLVVQYRKYPQLMTVRAKQMVEKVGGNLLGVVLNNINISQDSYYYYYSGYYYDYYYSHRDKDESEDKSKPSEDENKKDSTKEKLELKQKF